MTEEISPRSANHPELLITVDPDPPSLRTLLFFVLIVGSVVGYLVSQFIVAPEMTCSPLALLLGVAIGAGAMRLAEVILRPRWKSDKFVQLSLVEVATISKGTKESIIAVSESVTAHMWYFTVKRATRVPKGWHVVALALEGSDHILPVYSLMSPERFNELPRQEEFTELVGKRKQLEEDRASLRVAGQQRRLLRAESARDLHGVEMAYEDFILYIQWIDVHFPEWLPIR